MAEPSTPLEPTRRTVLKAAAFAGAGLVIGFDWGRRRFGDQALAAETTAEPFMPNAFVRIAPDDTVTVLIKHIEFGQGVATGLPTIVAEELDADWSQMRFEHAPSDPTRYNNLFFGPVQVTGGSTATANSWQQLRTAGATARAMLVSAAAAEWGVSEGEIRVEAGEVSHPGSGRSSGFGALAARAATLPVPEDVALKDPKDFRLIGQRLPRLDVPAKTDGTARFTQDLYLPDMLTALVAHPPRFGATVASLDASAAEGMAGVEHVLQVPQGVAVVARSFWAAKKGRDALEITWDDSAAETRSTAELLEQYRRLLDEPGLGAASRGDADSAIAGASRSLEAEYVFPYLAHAPMETLDCVIHLEADRCRAWAGFQLPTVDHNVIAQVTGLAPENVELTVLLGGGSFGRRATPTGDIAAEAAAVAKAVADARGSGAPPIKLIWTREDDIRGGHYRPLYVHRLRAGLDEAGNIAGWHHRIVGQSILGGSPFEAMIQDGIDATSVEGARNLPYDLADFRVELHSPRVGVPVLWWRSVGHTHNGYSTEVFFDELAHAAGQDPYEMRRGLLKEHPRHLAVLDLAAEKSGWGSPLPSGKARGIALQESFSSFVAQVAEISLDDAGFPKVERVVCAVDCGIAINPEIIRAQMESGIGYGLNAA
ncbi:MAG: xanthine dehydrogenase family protein molybdopterin-binding subunit, partial [Holophagales bacterium]|nr:xanthine dehydrogenase family protein molybdopterin-binding subunit [Holophagales bacterium]